MELTLRLKSKNRGSDTEKRENNARGEGRALLMDLNTGLWAKDFLHCYLAMRDQNRSVQMSAA